MSISLKYPFLTKLSFLIFTSPIGVACQYPKGLYVGLAYLGVLLSVLILYLGSRPKAKRGLFSLGRYYILQTYLIGGVVALVAVIVFMAKNKFDMLTSNDKSHLGSTTRP